MTYDSTAKLIMEQALGSRTAMSMLTELSVGIGPRLSGSPNAQKAVEWGKALMERLGFDNVHTEKVMVPHWVRNDTEECSIINSASLGTVPLTICTLGGSIAAPPGGITAEVVDVKSFDELKALGDQAKGKIIFFNRPMDSKLFNTFEAYGGAVGQRSRGAVEAARVGGVAALVRSMSTRIDDVPHTGAMNYNDSIPKIPTAAVSTLGADKLSDLLKKEKHVTLHLNVNSQWLPDVESANVIGELKGTQYPDQVVVIGGHLDSWDKGRGAHDDGAGVIHSVEALRLIKELNLKPRRTIRVVLFMNEENGDRGGKAYAAADRPGEKQIAAIESDAGGFTPRGFGVSADSLVYMKIASWANYFAPLDADRITKGGGGTDIEPLGEKKVPMLGLRVDGQRYFDYHHSMSDVIDNVNERELELGAAAMAIMSYLIAQEGL